MINNQTTIKDNPVAVAQADLNRAWSAMLKATQDYQADHSDENLQSLEDARARYARVEKEIIGGVRSLLTLGM